MERGYFLLSARPLVSFQAFLLTIALASEMFDPLLSLYVEDPGLCALPGVAVG